MHLLKGLIIGLSIAAPVGPIGVLCIQRTLDRGRVTGLVTGLGAATADGVYGAIAGFGVTIISNFLFSYQDLIRLIGGLFLLYLGFRTITSKPAISVTNNLDKDLWGAYLSTFFLTITNPLTILSFMAIFAGIGLANTKGNYFSALILILGVFLGSALWWFILSFLVNLIRNKFNQVLMQWVNRISGSIIISFGIAALVNVFL